MKKLTQSFKSKNLIIPGRIYKNVGLTPSVRETIMTKPRVAKYAYSKPFKSEVYWEIRKKIMPWNNSEYKRFSTGKYLKSQDKLKIFKRLNLLPGFRSPGTIQIPDRFLNIYQPPRKFPELAGFGEIGINEMNATNEKSPTAVSRGIWGSLNNLITQAGEMYTTVKKTKYEAQIEAAKERTALIRERIGKSKISTIAKGNVLPIAIIAGIGIAAIALAGAKKRERR